MERDVTVTPYSDRRRAKRISWGAIFAGTVIAISIGLLFAFIGLALGAGTIDPAKEQNTFSGFGIGGLIWWLVSGLISLFIGGWVAGRLSTVRHRQDGMLNGLVVWGLTFIATLYLLTTVIGAIIGGAFNVLKTTVTTVAQVSGDVAPQIYETIMPDNISRDQILNEAKTILRQTGKPELQPENLEQEGEQLGEEARQSAGEAAQNPQQAEQELNQALDRMLSQAGDVVSEVDKQAVVNVLVARTDMSEQEARSTVDQWAQVYQSAKQGLGRTADSVGQDAKQAIGGATDEIAKAAWWSFFMFLLGAIAAALGGFVGTDRAYIEHHYDDDEGEVRTPRSNEEGI